MNTIHLILKICRTTRIKKKIIQKELHLFKLSQIVTSSYRDHIQVVEIKKKKEEKKRIRANTYSLSPRFLKCNDARLCATVKVHRLKNQIKLNDCRFSKREKCFHVTIIELQIVSSTSFSMLKPLCCIHNSCFLLSIATR